MCMAFVHFGHAVEWIPDGDGEDGEDRDEDRQEKNKFPRKPRRILVLAGGVAAFCCSQRERERERGSQAVLEHYLRVSSVRVVPCVSIDRCNVT